MSLKNTPPDLKKGGEEKGDDTEKTPLNAPNPDEGVLTGISLPGQKQKGPKQGLRSFFFDVEEGMYCTFTSHELKIGFTRSMIKIIILVCLAYLYLIFWARCDRCILALATGSCALSCFGLGFLSISCYAGIIAALFEGWEMCHEIADVNIHWKK
jgi:hypothetical protein